MPSPPSYVRFTRPLFEAFARFILTVYCPVTVIGRPNLPPLPFLLCSNHSSHMDSVVLMVASGQSFRSFGLLAADDYFFRDPAIFRGFSCLVSLIPISRHPGAGSLQKTLDACRSFLGNGQRGLILFPEGTRSQNGEMAGFKRGGGMLSVKLGIPLVPAYIEGTRKAMPKGRFFPLPARVTVRIGAPVYPPTDPVAANGFGYDNIVWEARRRMEELKERGRGE